VGPPNVAGPWVTKLAYPFLFPPLDGPGEHRLNTRARMIHVNRTFPEVYRDVVSLTIRSILQQVIAILGLNSHLEIRD